MLSTSGSRKAAARQLERQAGSCDLGERLNNSELTLRASEKAEPAAGVDRLCDAEESTRRRVPHPVAEPSPDAGARWGHGKIPCGTKGSVLIGRAAATA